MFSFLMSFEPFHYTPNIIEVVSSLKCSFIKQVKVIWYYTFGCILISYSSTSLVSLMKWNNNGHQVNEGKQVSNICGVLWRMNTKNGSLIFWVEPLQLTSYLEYAWNTAISWPYEYYYTLIYHALQKKDGNLSFDPRSLTITQSWIEWLKCVDRIL